MKIGFIGLGRMGAGMAANLLAAGHAVTVYNRSPEKCAPLAEKGAVVAATVAEACRGEAVVTMLADDAALEAVTDGPGGLVAQLAPGALHVSASTVSVALSARLDTAHAAAGQAYVAAPVFGRPDVAAAGQLFIVTGGAATAVDRAMPLLEAMGRQVFRLTERPEAANLIKLSGNFLITTVIEALGEALALVGKGGIDPAAYLDFLTSTLFGAPVYRNYGKLIVDGVFQPPGFPAPLGLKDTRLVLAAAEELRVPLPLANLVRDRFLALLAQGGDGLDWSAIGALPGRDAGLK
ncbi:NAD(P)-dependent oxidoreductase [Zavarzinia sp.]|uniref:NAD(P)-dependent oxidoreductase n=1 Tax=Zavarzinia sp. TaxID=2027920 RepID=UPI0035640B2C